MALIQCPDCGHSISDRADRCIHCGRPMGLEVYKTSVFSLVLTQADFNDLTIVPLIQELTGMNEEDASALRTETPAVLKQGLTYHECTALASRLGRHTTTAILWDDDAGDPSYLPYAQPVLPPNKARPPVVPPLTFWKTVGAILTALLLWMCASWLISLLFSLILRFS